MGEVSDAATQAAVDHAACLLIENTEPGRWKQGRWDTLPSSHQGALMACHNADLIYVEARNDGIVEYKLAGAGEQVQHDRGLILAALHDDADVLLRHAAQAADSSKLATPTVEQPSEPKVDEITVAPRFQPPACKKCGAKSRVTSTRERTRYLQCTNEDCASTWKIVTPQTHEPL